MADETQDQINTLASSTAEWIKTTLPEELGDSILGFELWQWIGILLVIFLGLLARKITRLILKQIKLFTRRTKTVWDDRVIEAIESPSTVVVATGIWAFGFTLLNIQGMAREITFFILQGAVSLGIVWLCYKIISILGEFLNVVSRKTSFPLDQHLVPVITKTLKTFTIVMGILISLQNYGIEVGSLLAGLGIGGLAFALAAKDTAANLFGSIMILIDKPFKVGDWIVISKHEGTVEEIGLRSTRLRTFYNSQISVPNSILANENIDNMGRRIYRRAVQTLGISYSTKPDKMEAFMEGIKKIIQANPKSRKDYFHVVFKDYGAYSLNIMVYFFLSVKDWSEELVEKQNVLLEILRLAEDLGVDFAFPTQTIHVEQMGPKKEKMFNEEDLKKLAQDFGPQGIKSKPQGQGIFIPPYLES